MAPVLFKLVILCQLVTSQAKALSYFPGTKQVIKCQETPVLSVINTEIAVSVNNR